MLQLTQAQKYTFPPETNRHSTLATSVNSEPSNRKLALLENLYSDDDHDVTGDCQCWWQNIVSYPSGGAL